MSFIKMGKCSLLGIGMMPMWFLYRIPGGWEFSDLGGGFLGQSG